MTLGWGQRPLDFFESMGIWGGRPSNVRVLVYLDSSKAFDKVPHKRLLHKIESHGIGGNVAAWIGKWLCDRKQKVVLKGEIS